MSDLGNQLSFLSTFVGAAIAVGFGLALGVAIVIKTTGWSPVAINVIVEQTRHEKPQ